MCHYSLQDKGNNKSMGGTSKRGAGGVFQDEGRLSEHQKSLLDVEAKMFAALRKRPPSHHSHQHGGNVGGREHGVPVTLQTTSASKPDLAFGDSKEDDAAVHTARKKFHKVS